MKLSPDRARNNTPLSLRGTIVPKQSQLPPVFARHDSPEAILVGLVGLLRIEIAAHLSGARNDKRKGQISNPKHQILNISIQPSAASFQFPRLRRATLLSTDHWLLCAFVIWILASGFLLDCPEQIPPKVPSS